MVADSHTAALSPPSPAEAAAVAEPAPAESAPSPTASTPPQNSASASLHPSITADHIASLLSDPSTPLPSAAAALGISLAELLALSTRDDVRAAATAIADLHAQRLRIKLTTSASEAIDALRPALADRSDPVETRRAAALITRLASRLLCSSPKGEVPRSAAAEGAPSSPASTASPSSPSSSSSSSSTWAILAAREREAAERRRISSSPDALLPHILTLLRAIPERSPRSAYKAIYKHVALRTRMYGSLSDRFLAQLRSSRLLEHLDHTIRPSPAHEHAGDPPENYPAATIKADVLVQPQTTPESTVAGAPPARTTLSFRFHHERSNLPPHDSSWVLADISADTS